MSLLSSLPAPSKQHAAPVQPVAQSNAIAPVFKEVPPYLRRQNFVPRRTEDFGDGGAFPEIHVAQYPLDMGRPDQARGKQTLALSINSEGKVAYDALLKQGGNRNKVVHSEHRALIPKVDRLSAEVGGTLHFKTM